MNWHKITDKEPPLRTYVLIKTNKSTELVGENVYYGLFYKSPNNLDFNKGKDFDVNGNPEFFCDISGNIEYWCLIP